MAGRVDKKNGPAETAAHEVWRYSTSRGEQLLRRHWEENRHVHQLPPLCPFFDQLENIFCAMQLCIRCSGETGS